MKGIIAIKTKQIVLMLCLILLISISKVSVAIGNSQYDSRTQHLTNCTKIDKPGVYILSNSLTVDPREKICLEVNSSNVLIDGKMNRIYGFFEKGEKAILIGGNSTNILKNITLANVIIEGGYSGIKIKKAQDVSIISVYIKKPLEGVFIEDSSNILIENSRIDAEQRDVVSSNSVKLELKNNCFDSAYSHCVDITDNYYFLAENNSFLKCEGAGVQLDKTLWPKIIRNNIQNSMIGIEAINCSQPTVSNNFIKNSTQQALSIKFAKKGVLSQNKISQSQVGVFCQGCNITKFEDLSLFNSVVGFVIRNSSNISIVSPLIENISQNFLLIKGSNKILVDYSNIKKSESLIEDSQVQILIEKEMLKNNTIYNEKSSIIYEIQNGSQVITTENIKPLIENKGNITIKTPIKEEKSILEKISIKHIIISIIIALILVLIYSEIKLLTSPNKKRRRRKRK